MKHVSRPSTPALSGFLCQKVPRTFRFLSCVQHHGIKSMSDHSSRVEHAVTRKEACTCLHPQICRLGLDPPRGIPSNGPGRERCCLGIARIYVCAAQGGRSSDHHPAPYFTPAHRFQQLAVSIVKVLTNSFTSENISIAELPQESCVAAVQYTRATLLFFSPRE